MESIAVTFLLFLNTVFSTVPIPVEFEQDWKVESAWKRSEHGFMLRAASDSILISCASSPEKFILFPRIIHSAQQLILDGQPIYQFGDSSFQSAAPFYHQVSIPCKKLAGGKTLIWEAISSTGYFARLSDIPKVVPAPTLRLLTNSDSNAIAAGAILALSLFGFFVYRKRVRSDLLFSVTLAGLFAAGYFANTVNSSYGISVSMVESHRFADLCLWLSILFYFYFFHTEGLISKSIFYFQGVAVVIALGVIAFGKTSDVIQFGTTIPMIPFLLCSMYTIIAVTKRIQSGLVDSSDIAKLMSVVLFAASGSNDILNMFGIIDTPLISPLGATAAFFGLAVAVNQNIASIYNERDLLMTKLEHLVAEKTQHLTLALEQVKKSQAELVQSARLASLGTLSAGIAHEINNSINYVNGAIIPLERRIAKFIPDSEIEIVTKLFGAIKEGTSLTVEIVRSLRNFTGLNQSKIKDVTIKSMVDSVRTILKSRLNASAVELRIDIDPNLTMECHQVGINQVFMNLISNSLDAVKESSGVISVTAKEQSAGMILFEVSDNGSGIPKEVRERIFDPFFTTKDVGKGTGLGLHIVQKEIERHKGTIRIESEVGQGTKFVIELPKRSEIQLFTEAA